MRPIYIAVLCFTGKVWGNSYTWPEIFVFHYNLLLLGSISSNPVFKPLSFFLSDQCTSNSTCFNLHRWFSGWVCTVECETEIERTFYKGRLI